MKLTSLTLALSTVGALAIMQPALAQMSDMSIMAGGDAVTVAVPDDTLTIDSVTADADGYIVIHKVTDGKPGKVIGHADVKKGENKDIEVKLDEAVPAGEKLALMLHADTGAMGTYEFGMEGSKEDAPVMMDGKPVVEMVTVK